MPMHPLTNQNKFSFLIVSLQSPSPPHNNMLHIVATVSVSNGQRSAVLTAVTTETACYIYPSTNKPSSPSRVCKTFLYQRAGSGSVTSPGSRKQKPAGHRRNRRVPVPAVGSPDQALIRLIIRVCCWSCCHWGYCRILHVQAAGEIHGIWVMGCWC